ncbi:MAG: L-ribulose-5-phosphate 4-epimerase AraD [Solirubrobacterales bacterium]|nr:L-ribulose-5-phosphate 4-epimerase AraD [Solirubrobacterales bacterium]MBV9915616.1 L-ribulose-5-phosphate 4-epimerase AraD [Solirubrobacterales bacterium]
MLEALRQQVLAANVGLRTHGLVTLTWGNASGIDRERGLVAIKPSGVSYDGLRAQDIVIVDLDGDVVEGERKPSTDTPTHCALYRAWEEIGGVVHTHSTWATAWAQAQREIPLLGTTHADLTPHPIPLTRTLTAQEIERDYEAETATVVIEAVGERDPLELPCVLVRGHAPFCWGADPAAALENAVTLEQVAKMTLLSCTLEAEAAELDAAVREKHHQRKHGPQAYYGQR